MWSYVAVGIVCFAAGALFIWVMPKKRRVRMEISVEQVVAGVMHLTKYKRFRYTVPIGDASWRCGTIWATSRQAALEVLRRAHEYVELVETDHLPVTEDDKFVY